MDGGKDDSFLSGSEASREFDKFPAFTDVSLEFTQVNLERRIPNFMLINLIANEFPDLVTETNEVTVVGLIEILKKGAKINCLEALSDQLIEDLTYSLVRPLFS